MTRYRSRRSALSLCAALTALFSSGLILAQDARPGDPDWRSSKPVEQAGGRVSSSPFPAPEANDVSFVVDSGPGLDTGCTFSSGGPLLFTVQIDRVIGNLGALRANGLISETAMIRMPAYDVDIDANVPPYAPELNRVSFNGNVVPGEFLTGSNNIWKLNVFEVPIDWLNFPADPGPGATVQPAANQFRIDIDVGNGDDIWCTAIDWAAITIEVARPVVMAHGILSSGDTWIPWLPRLQNLGVPHSNQLNMGGLDSIGSNAGKIAAEVAAARSRWGVDKVNLVGHSKGGIDSRHYAENADDVAQLIQLGTPNAGSPLADTAQAGAIRLGWPGIVGSVLVHALAGPAGIQLTTPYMAGYNHFHGANPAVRYTAVAGDYDPDCSFFNPFCRPLDRTLLAISGSPGDTIVPIWSVHALPYTDNRIHFSSGDDKSATHSGIHTNGPVFDNIVRGRLADYKRARQGVGMIARTATVGGTMQQGDSASHSIPVDQSGPVFVTLMYPDGELGLVLVSPSGQIIDPTTAAADVGIEFQHDEMLGGRMAIYAFAGAEVGVWQALVDAVAVPAPGELAYSLNAWFEQTDLTLSASFANPAVQAGQVLDLYARVEDAGVGVAGAQVSAAIALPDDSVVELILLDQGDGDYVGQFTDTAQPGLYRVGFAAQRAVSVAGPAFSREAFGIATVSASSSVFTGAYADTGVDSNGNGLFDELRIDVGLDISHGGRYRLLGRLGDSQGNHHQANVVVDLLAGTQTVALGFDGAAIFSNGVDGPYTLSIARLGEEDEDGTVLPVAEAVDGHVTQAYSYLDFEHAALLLTGNGSSTGVDSDGNGLFDRLDVEVELLVRNGGFYEWSARLTDEHGTELGFHVGSAFFVAGLNSMSFSYPGEAIGSNGVDGPYHVSDLLLFGASQSLVAARVFTTQAYTASQFEGYSNDSDGDGIPDDLDACPNSNLAPTVVIDSCDSGVDNHLMVDGCTISDRVELCADNAANHGGFVSCVAHLTNELVVAGIILGPEKGRIQHCAAQANLP